MHLPCLHRQRRRQRFRRSFRPSPKSVHRRGRSCMNSASTGFEPAWSSRELPYKVSQRRRGGMEDERERLCGEREGGSGGREGVRRGRTSERGWTVEKIDNQRHAPADPRAGFIQDFSRLANHGRQIQQTYIRASSGDTGRRAARRAAAPRLLASPAAVSACGHGGDPLGRWPALRLAPS